MNRLWVRLSLAISGIILLLIIIPAAFCLGFGILFSSSDRGGDFHRFDRPQVFEERGASFRRVGPNLLFLIPPLVLQGIFLIGVFGMIVGVLVSRGLTRPLSELATAANKIGSGDLGHRVSVRGSKEMVDLAQSFNQMAVDLAQAEELRRNLMADVSHELRTPLTVLEGNLRAAIDHVYELDDEELANLYGQTHHLIQLVNDLHELALAEAHKLPLNLGPTDVSNLITEIVGVFTPLAEEKSIQLDSHLPETPVIIHADSARLRQVLHNLISNAIRHTSDGEAITVTVEQDHSTLEIQVADTGEGIDSTLVPYVFDRFYRTDRSRSRGTGGTGLGLAIVKAIIEAHGGQVSAHSPGVGQGSTFSIRLSSAATIASTAEYRQQKML